VNNVKTFWSCFFVFWPIAAIVLCCVAPYNDWWFPGESATALGQQIDDLFYMLLVIVVVTFIGTQIALCYAVWRAARNEGKAWHTHGSHTLEIIWSVVPSAILLFIAFYQFDVWVQFRITEVDEAKQPLTIAEVTARQFEWRIRYPAPDRVFKDRADVANWLKNPEPGDLYWANDLHVPFNKEVMIHLRSQDVQHSFFVPHLRIKQDAVPGQSIPIWFNVKDIGTFDWTCAELCGWGHYKMRAQVVSESEEKYKAFLLALQKEQNYDGTGEEPQLTSLLQNASAGEQNTSETH
jgi:cytochrome c oxidase subunit 2